MNKFAKFLAAVTLLATVAGVTLLARHALACAPPAAPTNLAAVTISNTEIKLTWTDNSYNETAFKVERSPNGSTGWSLVQTTAANVTTWNNTSLSAYTIYYYRVYAYNGASSGYSNIANATTDPNFSICEP